MGGTGGARGSGGTRGIIFNFCEAGDELDGGDAGFCQTVGDAGGVETAGHEVDSVGAESPRGLVGFFEPFVVPYPPQVAPKRNQAVVVFAKKFGQK